MFDCRKLLLLFVALTVARALGAPSPVPVNTRHNGDGTNTRPTRFYAVNGDPRQKEKSKQWDAFRIKNDINSDSKHIGRGPQSNENIEKPLQSNQKNHQIFHPGINMDVSNMLDDLEALIVRLYRKIYGQQSADKWHNSRQLVGDSRHRVSTMVKELITIFPQVKVREKRSETNQSEIVEGGVQNDTFYFANYTSNWANSENPTFDGAEEPLLYWFNLGSDVADFWRSSMYSLTRRILDANITGEYLNTLNTYLAPFKVQIGTRKQYKESNTTSPATNATHRHFFTRKKRNIDEDIFDHRFDRLIGFKDRDGLRDSLSSDRRRDGRMYYSDGDHEYISPDRDDGYGGHDSYGYGGGLSYAKLDPYVVLGALATCTFIGAMVLSLYCKMEGSPCCDDSNVNKTISGTTTPMFEEFDDGAIRTDIPFFFGLSPNRKYDLPWAQ